MGIEFRRPPVPELSAERAKFVIALRELIQSSVYESQDELARSLYGRPLSSKRREGKRISELARGIRLPDRAELQRLVQLCDPSSGDRIERLYAVAYSESVSAQNSAADNDEFVPYPERTPVFRSHLPRQLPSDAYPFVGRSTELVEIARYVEAAGECPVIGLVGMPSVGKTAIAVRWAYQHRSEFPDGQLFVDLNGFGIGRPLDSGRVLRDLLIALGVPASRIPVGVDGRAGLFRGVVADLRLVLVYDNVASFRQVQPLLPSVGNSVSILTSRWELTDLAVRRPIGQVRVDPLDDGTARQLFESVYGQAVVPTSTAGRLLRRASGLPLAIRSYAAAVSRYTFNLVESNSPDWIEKRPFVPIEEGLEYQDDDLGSAWESFAWSYLQLDQEVARVLRLVALHPGPLFGVDAATAVVGLEINPCRRALAKLVQASLLTEPWPGRYRLHDLMREFVLQRASVDSSPESLLAAEYRVLAWYLYVADAADTLIASQRRRISLDVIVRPDRLPQFTSRQDALAWCDQELPNIGFAVERAAELQLHDIAWRLPAALWNFFYLRKCFDEWTSLNQIALASALAIENADAASFACNGIASSMRHQRRFSDAALLYRQALDYAESSGDKWRDAWLHNNLAESLKGMEKFRAALEEYQFALDLADEIGDTWSRGCFLTNLGEAYTAIGQCEDALKCHRAALPLRRAHDHTYGEAWTYNGLGEAYTGLGQLDEAIGMFDTALQLRDRVGDRYGRAWTLRSLGAAYHERGDVNRTMEVLEEALRLSRGDGDAWGVAKCADQLAQYAVSTGKFEAARDFLIEAELNYSASNPGLAEEMAARRRSLVGDSPPFWP